MMVRPRKLAVQLTPLLDLLLIVLFAQLLDVRGHETSSRELAGEAQTERDQITQQLAALEAAHSRSLDELQQLRDRNRALEDDVVQRANDAETTAARLDRTDHQRPLSVLSGHRSWQPSIGRPSVFKTASRGRACPRIVPQRNSRVDNLSRQVVL